MMKFAKILLIGALIWTAIDVRAIGCRQRRYQTWLHRAG